MKSCRFNVKHSSSQSLWKVKIRKLGRARGFSKTNKRFLCIKQRSSGSNTLLRPRNIKNIVHLKRKWTKKDFFTKEKRSFKGSLLGIYDLLSRKRHDKRVFTKVEFLVYNAFTKMLVKLIYSTKFALCLGAEFNGLNIFVFRFFRSFHRQKNQCLLKDFYLLKVSNGNTIIMCEDCSMLTIKTAERRH